MALRGIEDTFTIQFDPRKEFSCDIPRGFLEYETDTARIERIWKDFLSSMNRLCKSRQAFFQNKHFKKSIFASAMDQLCKDFSRRTEAVKVSFEYHKAGTRKTYLLNFRKLTEIPESCRNIQFCVAEIPPLEMQAYAQFVSMTDGNIAGRYDPEVRVAAVVENGNSREIPGAQATVVEDSTSIVSSIRSTTTVSSQPPQYQQSQQDTNYDYEVNPPIAMAVPEATVEVPIAPDQRSALERMQELESIKSFLSETEFATKRQCILNSI